MTWIDERTLIVGKYRVQREERKIRVESRHSLLVKSNHFSHYLKKHLESFNIA